MREAEVGIANTKDVPRLAQRFEDALVFAARLHASDIRKGTTIPYLAHLLGTASIALEHGATEDEAIAALLHDAVEDHGPGELVKIRERFGDVVADIVAGCTDADVTPKPPWRVRKETYVRHLQDAPPSVRLVSASDKLHNARAILSDYRAIGDALWSRFQGGKRARCGTTARASRHSARRERRRSSTSSTGWSQSWSTSPPDSAVPAILEALTCPPRSRGH